jgi:hypothetical protein
VNLGGDPERDDFGLPPVDIEIPDDARELDRDVQAYHRELRAQRRRMRARRLHGPLTRDGMVLPLLAGCLVLALISGTLLTLFSAGQADMPRLPGTGAKSGTTGNATARGSARSSTAAGQQAAGQTGASAAAGPSAGTASAVPTPAIGQVGGPLPDETLLIAGRSTRLRSLPPVVLALIPAGCQCVTALRQLVKQATTARVALYFVGTAGVIGQLRRLAVQSGQHPTRVAMDVRNVLGTAYRPSGLTAILVHADGAVAGVEAGLRPGLALTHKFMLLPAGS